MRYFILLLLINSYFPVVSQSMPGLNDQQRYFMKELSDAYGGMYNMSSNYPKAQYIYQQLVAYSGMSYYITFAQTFNWGQAHNGGIIILDYSTLNKSPDILAFVFSHEWGHQALGHAANIYFPYGNSKPQYYTMPSAKEDEADYYAGRFLATYGYDLDVVTDYLNSLPDNDDHTHSSGAARARIVTAAYTRQSGSSQGSSSRSICSTCSGKGTVIDYVTCNYCNGGGTIYCPACRGQGTYVAQGYNAYGVYGWWYYPCRNCGGNKVVVCSGCRGGGRLQQRVRCEDCGGSGYVTGS